MAANRMVLVSVIIQAPSPLLDPIGPAIPPINFDVIQVVICNAA